MNSEESAKVIRGLLDEIKVEMDKKEGEKVDVAFVQGKLDECTTAIEMFGMDYQDTDSKKIRRDFKKEVREFTTSLEFKKRNQGEGPAPAPVTADEMMTHGRDLQQQTAQSLDRTLGVIGDTRALAADVAIAVHKQTVQLGRIGDEVDATNNIVSRSRKTISRIGRKLATDKGIWIFILLVVVGIAIILYLHYK